MSGSKPGEISIDKARLLRQAIAQVEQSLQQLGSGYAVAKQAVLDSPHVMKSKREVVLGRGQQQPQCIRLLT